MSTAGPSSRSSSSPRSPPSWRAWSPPASPLPVVVLEIVFGIVVGPELLGLAESDEFLDFFSNLGLGMLFFFAGYEIDFERIRGSPLRLAALGWVLSLVLAYGLGGLLELSGLVLSLLFTGSALATTAIGTLIPILSDAGELRTRFGTYLLAAGAMGEFGPILLVTLVFSTKGAAENAVILLAFVVVAVVVGRGRRPGSGPRLGAARANARDQRSAGDPHRGRHRLRARRAGRVARPGPAAGRIRRRGDRPHRAEGARGPCVRVEAHRGRLRLLHPVLLRGERHRVRPRRPHRYAAPAARAAALPRPVPGGARRARAAPVSRASWTCGIEPPWPCSPRRSCRSSSRSPRSP